MVNAFQDDRLGSAIDAADRPPIAVPHPYSILMAAQRPNRWVHRERVGEGFNPGKQGAPVAPGQYSEIFDGDWRNNQPHDQIIEGADQAVNDFVSPTATNAAGRGATIDPRSCRRGHRMRRRNFLMMLGGVAILRPLAARAQGLPVVGYINAASPEDSADLLGAFRQGLSQAGYVEGRNVAIEYRWAGGHYDRLPTLAADVVRRHVTVIAATSTPVALAAKEATGTIPIIFTIGGDPVKVGLVSSLNRPDGNLTGVTRYNVELGPKRLELLHDLVPGATEIGLLVNPSNPNTGALAQSVHEAARMLGVEIHLVKAENDNELDNALTTLTALQVGAVTIGNDPFFNSRSERLAELALRHSLPAIYQYRRFVEAGGLMSYGASNTDSHHRLGTYVGRILAGATPRDLPVEESTKVDFLLNLKTAKTLGVTIPQMILARADEIIE